MTSYLRQKFQYLTSLSSDVKEDDDFNTEEEIELTKIGIMRTLIHKEDPSPKVNPKIFSLC